MIEWNFINCILMAGITVILAKVHPNRILFYNEDFLASNLPDIDNKFNLDIDDMLPEILGGKYDVWTEKVSVPTIPNASKIGNITEPKNISLKIAKNSNTKNRDKDPRNALQSIAGNFETVPIKNRKPFPVFPSVLRILKQVKDSPIPTDRIHSNGSNMNHTSRNKRDSMKAVTGEAVVPLPSHIKRRIRDVTFICGNARRSFQVPPRVYFPPPWKPLQVSFQATPTFQIPTFGSMFPFFYNDQRINPIRLHQNRNPGNIITENVMPPQFPSFTKERIDNVFSLSANWPFRTGFQLIGNTNHVAQSNIIHKEPIVFYKPLPLSHVYQPSSPITLYSNPGPYKAVHINNPIIKNNQVLKLPPYFINRVKQGSASLTNPPKLSNSVETGGEATVYYSHVKNKTDRAKTSVLYTEPEVTSSVHKDMYHNVKLNEFTAANLRDQITDGNRVIKTDGEIDDEVPVSSQVPPIADKIDGDVLVLLQVLATAGKMDDEVLVSSQVTPTAGKINDEVPVLSQVSLAAIKMDDKVPVSTQVPPTAGKINYVPVSPQVSPTAIKMDDDVPVLSQVPLSAGKMDGEAPVSAQVPLIAGKTYGEAPVSAQVSTTVGKIVNYVPVSSQVPPTASKVDGEVPVTSRVPPTADKIDGGVPVLLQVLATAGKIDDEVPVSSQVTSTASKMDDKVSVSSQVQLTAGINNDEVPVSLQAPPTAGKIDVEAPVSPHVSPTADKIDGEIQVPPSANNEPAPTKKTDERFNGAPESNIFSQAITGSAVQLIQPKAVAPKQSILAMNLQQRNPLIVPDEKNTYSDEEVDADRSSINVQGNDIDDVSVDFIENIDSIYDENNRGDIPNTVVK